MARRKVYDLHIEHSGRPAQVLIISGWRAVMATARAIAGTGNGTVYIRDRSKGSRIIRTILGS